MADTIRVPPQWPARRPCKIAFVGEAPSDEEIDGEPPQPFLGPAGRVFNAILRSANIDRAECLVTNVFDEKAPDNDCTEWMADKGRTDAAFARLRGEIEACNPNVIVPLGATALWAFLGTNGIKDYRGAVTKATRVVPGAKILPTFHPAYIIKQWKHLPIAVADFIKAACEGEFAKVRYPSVELIIEPTLAEVKAFCHECLKADLLSTDIETGWGQITNIGLAPTPKLAMNIPFWDVRKPNRSWWPTLDDELAAWAAIREPLECRDVPKLGQNFTYDAMWLYRKANIGVRNYREDIRLMHHVMFPELPKDLGTMGGLYTNLGPWKNWSGRQEKRDA